MHNSISNSRQWKWHIHRCLSQCWLRTWHLGLNLFHAFIKVPLPFSARNSFSLLLILPDFADDAKSCGYSYFQRIEGCCKWWSWLIFSVFDSSFYYSKQFKSLAIKVIKVLILAELWLCLLFWIVMIAPTWVMFSKPRLASHKLNEITWDIWNFSFSKIFISLTKYNSVCCKRGIWWVY